ncbi:unnamed protein product [Sphagnum compactum]
MMPADNRIEQSQTLQPRYVTGRLGYRFSQPESDTGGGSVSSSRTCRCGSFVGGATTAACMKVPGGSAIGYCSEAGRSVRLQVKMLAILGN